MTRRPKPEPPRCYASQETARLWLCCDLPQGHEGEHKAHGIRWTPPEPPKGDQ